MRTLLAGLCVLLLSPAGISPGRAEGAAAFDYYVLSLSWSPNWCALEGDARRSPQCAVDHGWILHGLWPQFDRGYPSYCQTAERAPSRNMTGAMADIMGTGALAWHQWKKHGSCTGLPAADYFALSRAAYTAIIRPAILRDLARPVRLPASVIEEAFLRANPGLERDGITITCKEGHIQEARICLARDLTFVPCGPEVVRDCRMKDAVLEPVRK